MTVSRAEETVLSENPSAATQVSGDEDQLTASFYYANPYAPVHSSPEAFRSAANTEDEDIPEITVSNAEELVPEYRDFMVKRVSRFKVVINAETEGDYNALINEVKADVDEVMTEKVFAHTGNPEEGDYLKYQYENQGYDMNAGIQYDGQKYLCSLTFTFHIDYYTTSEQEQEVTERLGEVFAELGLDEKSDYEKVKAIHDYIAANTVYDYVHLGDESYKLQYTAYGALINGTSVCQGYANLFYRMCLETGIDNRIISGQGEGNNGWEAHAWNIVKLGDLYYHLDVTWDDPTVEGNPDYLRYDYFLKGKNTFAKDHRAEGVYVTEEFAQEYPISEEDYVRSYWDDYPDDRPSLVSASLLLSGEIGVNLYMKLPAFNGADYSNSYMEFTVSGLDGTTTTVPMDENAKSSDGRMYKFTCYVNSVQMADSISAVYHYHVNGDEETVEYEYTVKRYMENLGSYDDIDNEAKELAKALADYGHYVQQYMADVKGWTVGTDHAEMDQYYLEDPGSYAKKYADSFNNDILNGHCDLLSNLAVSLKLDSSTSINIYFDVAEDFSGDIKAVDADTETVYEVKKVGRSKYMAVIPDIPAHLLNTKYHIDLDLRTDDIVYATRLNVAAADYAKLCLLKQDITENEKNAMVALCRYADQAAEYKKTHQ
ncbi:MAG: hypothetical protein IKD69_12655 [Solobacterium sp.]|nr:hypothetical protein [Solobacterium sp.]